MDTLHRLALLVHISIGAVALIVFWLPVFSRKGSAFHRRAGSWFANGMYAVAASGLFMSTLTLIDPIGVRFAGQPLSAEEAAGAATRIRMFSLFLLMLSVLVYTSVRHSILVLRARDDRSVLRQARHVGPQLALALLGLGVGLTGIATGQLLLMIFAAVSIALAAGMLRYSFKASLARNEWWVAHLSNMIGGGIGAYTAFFAFGGQRFLSGLFAGQWQVVPWVLPSVIGTIFIVYLSRHYRRKFAAR